MSVPVPGLGETSMLAACMHGRTFSGVAFRAKQAQYCDRKAHEYGLAARHLPFGELGMDFNEVQDAFAEPARLKAAFLAAARRLAAQGAEVIFAACATVNAIVRREGIHEVGGALVLDCNAVLLEMTEVAVELARVTGLGPSRRLFYRRPSRGRLGQWLRRYGCRAAAPRRARHDGAS